MVDPAYQRMGAGRLLVKWGLAEADKMGVDVNICPHPLQRSHADCLRPLSRDRARAEDCTHRRVSMARIMFAPYQRSLPRGASRSTGG
jgi:hypothetical protein